MMYVRSLLSCIVASGRSINAELNVLDVFAAS